MRRRLRVLVLSRSYPNPVLPTLGPWVEQPTSRLLRHVELRVVSPVPWCPPLPDVGPFAQYARFRRVPRHELRLGVDVLHPRFPSGPGTSLYALEAGAYAAGVVRAVDRLRREFRFDLIHAHFIYPDGAVAHRLSRRYGVPFVVTEHAPWSGWLDRLGVGRQALPAGAAAAKIMTVSTYVRATVHERIPGARVEVIPVGVDLDLFVPAPEERRRRDLVLFVGFINLNKGVDVLLEAMRTLAARSVPARLVLVGGAHYRNTRVQEERLRRDAAALGLGDRIAFTGKLAQSEVARLMAESAVVVLPSVAESFGAVLVEALACGTPVVATRCGGPEDIVVGDVGTLVPVGDADALADALAETLASGSRVPPDRLRAYASERFGWERIVDRIAEVYRLAAA